MEETMDARQINNITSAGLVYTDANGTEAFIDFSVCYANYLKHVTSPEHLKDMREVNRWTDADERRYVQERGEWKEVAARGEDGFPWSAHPEKGPCIAFYTEPPIRFVFAPGDDAFYKVCASIRRMGWRTVDLS
jgi:hypothetical protein